MAENKSEEARLENFKLMKKTIGLFGGDSYRQATFLPNSSREEVAMELTAAHLRSALKSTSWCKEEELYLHQSGARVEFKRKGLLLPKTQVLFYGESEGMIQNAVSDLKNAFSLSGNYCLL